MAWVYILRGDSGRHYIGSTLDLQRRFQDHLHGNTHTTKRLGQNLHIVCSREFPTLQEARAMEKFLKAKKNPLLAIYNLEKR